MKSLYINVLLKQHEGNMSYVRMDCASDNVYVAKHLIESLEWLNGHLQNAEVVHRDGVTFVSFKNLTGHQIPLDTLQSKISGWAKKERELNSSNYRSWTPEQKTVCIDQFHQLQVAGSHNCLRKALIFRVDFFKTQFWDCCKRAPEEVEGL